MALSGCAYYSQYGATESYDDEFEGADLVWYREIGIGGISSFAGLALGIVIALFHAKIAIIGWILSIITITVSSAIVIYMSFVFVKFWSIIWMFGWMAAVMFDIGVGHLLLMWITQAFIKIGPDFEV